MLGSIARRIKWLFYRRLLLRLKLKGFTSSMLSFAYENCTFSEYNTISGASILFNTKIGRFSYVTSAQISNSKIGAFTSIGPGVKIGGFGKHPMHWISTHPAFYSTRPPSGFSFSDKNYFEEFLPVNIGNDVWIGERAMILDGVNIGNGAVIGAGSIVTKDVLPYEVVAGVPAKKIRFRFSDKEIIELEKAAWWDRDVNFYLKNAAQFRDENISKFIEVLNS
jgi:chloramphenicol O-acetyltransferase type B